MKIMAAVLLFLGLISSAEAIEQTNTSQPAKKEACQLKWKLVWSWSLPQTTDQEVETMVKKANSLGFNALASGTTNRKAFVRACSQNQMESFLPILPGNNQPQKMETREMSLPAGRDRSTEYQHGGEPLTGKAGTEILYSSISCLRQPATFEHVKKKIDEGLACGYTGLAFDFFGYRNYHSCECDLCKKLFKPADYPGLSRSDAWNRFQEDSIILLYEKAVAYAKNKAKSLKRTVKTTCHVYPVFLPNVFYGRRIPVDYCGETVSWFFQPHWNFDKIVRYSNEIVKEQASVHSGSIASPFIAFYSTGNYARDAKTPERVRREIQIVKQSGAGAIQFAELGHILAAPEVARVIEAELNGK